MPALQERSRSRPSTETNIDFQLEHALNRHAGHHPTLDWLARHIAESQYWVVAALLLLAIGGVLVRRNWLTRAAIVAIVAAGAALLGNILVSHLIWTRDRPFVTHRHLVHLLVHHAADASFPSDHSTALAAITISLAFVERRFAAVFAAWAVLVGIARVYVGEHYPGDILGGWAVGIVCGVAVALVAKRMMLGSRGAGVSAVARKG